MEPRGSWSKPGNDYNRRNYTPGFPLIFKQPWEEGVSPFPGLGSSLREAGWLFWGHLTRGREATDLGPSRPDRHCNLTLRLLWPRAPVIHWLPERPSEDCWAVILFHSADRSCTFALGTPSFPHYIIFLLLWPGQGEKGSCRVVTWVHTFQSCRDKGHWFMIGERKKKRCRRAQEKKQGSEGDWAMRDRIKRIKRTPKP